MKGDKMRNMRLLLIIVLVFTMTAFTTYAQNTLRVGKIDTALAAVFHPYMHNFNPLYRSIYRDAVPWAEEVNKVASEEQEQRQKKIDSIKSQLNKLEQEENDIITRKNDELRANSSDYHMKISKASTSADPSETYKVRENYRKTSDEISAKYEGKIQSIRKKQLELKREISMLSEALGSEGSPQFLSAKELKVVFSRIEKELIQAINEEISSSNIDFVVNTGFKIPLKFLAGIANIPFKPSPAMRNGQVEKLSKADASTIKSSLYLLERFSMLQVISNNLGDSIGALTFSGKSAVTEVDLTIPVMVRVLKKHKIEESVINEVRQTLTRLQGNPKAELSEDK